MIYLIDQVLTAKIIVPLRVLYEANGARPTIDHPSDTQRIARKQNLMSDSCSAAMIYLIDQASTARIIVSLGVLYEANGARPMVDHPPGTPRTVRDQNLTSDSCSAPMNYHISQVSTAQIIASLRVLYGANGARPMVDHPSGTP
jgi:hypothetical protein